jgi:hypothetical protein
MNSCKDFPLIFLFLLIIILKIHANADVINANSSSDKTHAQLVAEQRARNLEADRRLAAENKALKEKLLAFCKEKDLTCKDGSGFRRCHLAESPAEENWCLQTLKWGMNVQNVSALIGNMQFV